MTILDQYMAWAASGQETILPRSIRQNDQKYEIYAIYSDLKAGSTSLLTLDFAQYDEWIVTINLSSILESPIYE